MKTDLNHDRIAMIIERARRERSIAAGRAIATAMHKVLDWMEKGSPNTRQPEKQHGYHLSSEGSRPNTFDTSAFV
ncbi:MAG: hypothetical protein JNM54_13705 [Candidatus Accumulibacter sp.]|jgi:hypothetical protein|uniref:hypothetical protein n=1 Tax=Accumulibacter sp. TaxID=2053492 RepID=UPI0012C284FB|nr:hypothetical protein [Accumulibacter sp.]MBL8368948.1 hypothetical protein [Accumulibacter sp.]MQM34221.1 hypothetical protein [Candidatus Accumulibacter phosphatis]